MQTRYMERTNSMREKRKLEEDDNNPHQQQQQPERKKPALASLIVEPLKMDSLQRLCSSLKPILCGVAKIVLDFVLLLNCPDRRRTGKTHYDQEPDCLTTLESEGGR